MTANTTNRPGRNDLCFCGSGEKYKRCCLGTAAEKGVKSRGLPIFLLVLGVVGGILIGINKGFGSGIAIFAASVLFAIGVYVIRDPAPRRDSSGDASAINFGTKK